MTANIRLRHVLFVGFTTLSVTLVFFFAARVGRSTLEKEVPSATDKQLLVARNLTAAFARCVVDTELVFGMVAEA